MGRQSIAAQPRSLQSSMGDPAASSLLARHLTRRGFCAACAAGIGALALGAGCTPGSGDKVHLVVKVPRTGHSVVFDGSITQVETVIQAMANDFAATYETRPVEVEVVVFEQNQYDAAVKGAFDTAKSPDVLYGDYFNISSYIHTGRVVPLDEVATAEVRADVSDYLWDMSMVEDRVFMMPYLARQNVLAYNKELFRQAGLGDFIVDGEITSWSLEEWTYILDTLAANLPRGTFPMMMYAASSQGDTHIMTLLRSAGSSFFDGDGHFALNTPEGIAALRWIQEGVGRGWFPPHAENLEIEDCSSLFRAGPLAIYMVNNASIGRYGDTVGLVNFPGPDEGGCVTTFISGFEAFDNGDAEKLAVAKDFIAFVYGSEHWLDYAAGAMPASKRVAERYGAEIPCYDLFRANIDNVVDFTGSNPDTLAVRDVFYPCIHDLLMGKLTPEECAARIDADCNAAIDAGLAASRLHD